jgi:phosphatidylserine/phosphatidylglycerophosphate/cardiolipin synthase-like enzyme
MLDVLNHVRVHRHVGGLRQRGPHRRPDRAVGVERCPARHRRCRVWALHDQGCKVSLIINGFNNQPQGPGGAAQAEHPHRQMTVYNAGIDTNGTCPGQVHGNHKVLMINGRWFSQSKKVVYTGSANFTGTALLSNNELIMRVIDNPTYDAYYSNFNYIRNNWTKRITKAPPIPVTGASTAAAARVESKLETQLAAQPDTADPAKVPLDPAQVPAELAPTEPAPTEPAPVEPGGGR